MGKLTHGMRVGGCEAPEYRALRHAIDRCHNARHKQFADYGLHGITVCQEWRDNPAAFLVHIGPKPSPTHRLDRHDNDKGYAPGNVRWVTPRVSCINIRLPRSSKTGLRGVSWNKGRGNYRAQITPAPGVDNIHIGSTPDMLRAAVAYDLAAIMFHGAEAHLNFPRETYAGIDLSTLQE